MVRDELSVLSAFLTVAEERSFTRAAKRLGVSPSALSHAIHGLEERIGVRLLARTTRSVAPTDAGAQFISRLGPALADVRGAWQEVAGLNEKPSGRIRLVASRLSGRMVIARKLAEFARAYPEVVIDLTTTEEARIDLVREGFDAGIHLGEFIARDMVAVRVSKEQRAAIVGSPGYMSSHGKPKVPRDLTAHACINFRHGASGMYHWEFQKGRKSLSVAVTGPLIVDDVEIMIQAAIDGAGLAYGLEEHVAAHLSSGRLARVLEDWCPPFAGYFLYYPTRRQHTPAMAALIDSLRMGTASA